MSRQQPILALARRCGSGRCAASPILSPISSSARVQHARISFQHTVPCRRLLSSAVPKKHAVAAGKAISFADQLARKNGATILYEAPSHIASRFSSYAAGIFCFLFSGYHYVTGMTNPPPDIAWYVPHLYGAVVLAMGSMGTFFISGAGRIVRVIAAVPRTTQAVAKQAAAPASPSASASPAQKAAAAAATAAASRKLPIQLEITASRYIPFFGPSVMRVEADQVVLPARLQQLREMVEYLRQEGTPGGKPTDNSARVRLAEAAARRARLEAEAKYDREHLMTSPFRHLGRAMREGFVAARRSLTGEGFVRIRIDGVRYKLDVSNPWVLDEGRSVDRLVTIDETMQRRSKLRQ